MFKGGISSHFYNQHSRLLKISGWFLPSSRSYDKIVISDFNDNVLIETSKSQYRYDAVEAFSFSADHALCGWTTSLNLPKESIPTLKIDLFYEAKVIYNSTFTITNIDQIENIMKINKASISEKSYASPDEFEKSGEIKLKELITEIKAEQIDYKENVLNFKEIMNSYYSSGYIELKTNDKLLNIAVPEKEQAKGKLQVSSVFPSTKKILSKLELKSNTKHNFILAKKISPIFTENEFLILLTFINNNLELGGTAVLQSLPLNTHETHLVYPDNLSNVSNLSENLNISKSSKVVTLTAALDQSVTEYFTPQKLSKLFSKFENLSFEIIHNTNSHQIPEAPLFSLSIRKRS